MMYFIFLSFFICDIDSSAQDRVITLQATSTGVTCCHRPQLQLAEALYGGDKTLWENKKEGKKKKSPEQN